MSLLPPRFLVRLAHPCRHVPGIPAEDADELFDLPESCRLDNFAAVEGAKNFADVRLAWNEFGVALQLTVTGKSGAPEGDAGRPRQSDGVTLWLDTRDARTGHRASRYCHQFHVLAAGGGADRSEPTFVQTKIHRALEDAPPAAAGSVPFAVRAVKRGYRAEAFFPAAALNGFDPEQSPRLGVFYAVRDGELGEQTLGVSADFPFWEDPSLWHVLELVKD